MAIYCEMSKAPNIRDLIQKDTYEMIIWRLMNESNKVFPSKYKYIEKQSHSECDFIDIVSEQKYDAKVLFSEQQCKILAKGNGIEHLQEWYKSVNDELDEASNNMMRRNLAGIRKTILYKEFHRRLESVSDDEEAILFIPFLIVPESKNSIFMQFASDIVSTTYDSIVEDYPEKLKDKNTFIIYPSVIDQKVVLRNLTSSIKEYLPIKLLSPYITFTLKDYPDA